MTFAEARVFARWSILAFWLMASAASGQSITLTPAVVTAAGSPGQALTRGLTLQNDSDAPLDFFMEARDVVVRDGRRVELRPGELAASVAATAVFSRAALTVDAHAKERVDVTLTLPPTVAQRAVHVYFRGVPAAAPGRSRALLSLGTLFTFDLGGTPRLHAGTLAVTPPDDSRDLAVRLPLANTGPEAVVATGMLAVLDASGRLLGKTALTIPRLLPDERAEAIGEYPGELAPGTYRVIATIDTGGEPLSAQSLVTVP